MEIVRHESNGRMSKVVIYNNTLYVSGQTARGVEEDIKKQTQAVLEKIEQILRQYGSGKDKLLSATIYLKDMSLFEGMNSVWDSWVIPGNEPARATVQAALADSGLLVEVSVIAAV